MSPEKGAQKKRVAKLTQKAIRAARALEEIPHPGSPFPHKHYVYIGRAKAGELWSLNNLSVEARAGITPLLELVPPAAAQKEKKVGTKVVRKAKPAKPLPQHAADVLKMVKSDWNSLPLFLDTKFLKVGSVPSADAARIVFDTARAVKLNAVPVTSLPMSEDFQRQIGAIIATDMRGVMVRLSPPDFKRADLLNSLLAALLKVLHVPPSQVDILIDMGRQTEHFTAQQVGLSALSRIPTPAAWRTLTLAAGCFPESISKWKHDAWLPIDRTEWLSWLDIVSDRANAAVRIPSYGDYGIRSGGEPLDVPNQPDPNMRYSLENKILVRRAKKKDGAIKQICASLVALKEFCGADFSEGDRQIAARAAMPGLPNNGQPFQWIQWCTNHHLELTTSQIRKLPSP
jgi:hypothetical protein